MMSVALKTSVVVGWGGYLPDQILTNEDMARQVDTSDDWIVSRTGIRQRHFAAAGQYTSDLAVEAARRALAVAGLDAQDIDLILVCTTTPDRTFPSTAALVQGKLGNTCALAFDVAGVCAGFLVGLNTADNYLKLGQGKRALVIGAEVMSSLLDMEDRRTCVLFGDGAGAVILEGCPWEKKEKNPRGVMGVRLQTDGHLWSLLHTDGGPSMTGHSGKLRMKGQDVYRHAVSKLTASAQQMLKDHHLTVADVDWFIPHQANARIIESVAQRLDLPMDKIILSVQDHANTSAASIPLALWTGITSGRVKPGELILHEAIGGGLIWGSALLRL